MTAVLCNSVIILISFCQRLFWCERPRWSLDSSGSEERGHDCATCWNLSSVYSGYK